VAVTLAGCWLLAARGGAGGAHAGRCVCLGAAATTRRLSASRRSGVCVCVCWVCLYSTDLETSTFLATAGGAAHTNTCICASNSRNDPSKQPVATASRQWPLFTTTAMNELRRRTVLRALVAGTTRGDAQAQVERAVRSGAAAAALGGRSAPLGVQQRGVPWQPRIPPRHQSASMHPCAMAWAWHRGRLELAGGWGEWAMAATAARALYYSQLGPRQTRATSTSTYFELLKNIHCLQVCPCLVSCAGRRPRVRDCGERGHSSPESDTAIPWQPQSPAQVSGSCGTCEWLLTAVESRSTRRASTLIVFIRLLRCL